MQTRSNPFIVTGIVLLVVGALLVVLTPAVAATVVSASGEGDQLGLIAVEIATRVVSAVLPPLGAALLTAGLIQRRLDDHPADDS